MLTQDFSEWRHELDRFVSEGAMRAAHSLAGSSATVGFVPSHDLAAGIEDVLLDAAYYRPTSLGAEAAVKERGDRVRRIIRGRAAIDDAG